MFELLDVKIKENKPTSLDLLDEYYGRSTILMRGKNGKWYKVEDGHGADLVWIECEETAEDIRRSIANLNMEDVTEIVIIEDAEEVWCDNGCGKQIQPDVLDITKIKTVEDINSTDFSKYTDDAHPSWVRRINDPVSADDLDRICILSRQPGSKVELGWSMGELFYHRQ